MKCDEQWNKLTRNKIKKGKLKLESKKYNKTLSVNTIELLQFSP